MLLSRAVKDLTLHSCPIWTAAAQAGRAKLDSSNAERGGKNRSETQERRNKEQKKDGARSCALVPSQPIPRLTSRGREENVICLRVELGLEGVEHNGPKSGPL